MYQLGKMPVFHNIRNPNPPTQTTNLLLVEFLIWMLCYVSWSLNEGSPNFANGSLIVTQPY